MALFLIKLPGSAVGMLKNGVNAMIVSAADQAQAEKACAAKFTGFASETAWDGATAVALADVASNADDALVGWRFHVLITGAAGMTVDPVDITFTGVAADDTIDTIADELVTLLNATDDIANAAYNSTTQVLTLASGSGGDDLGDATVVVEVFPPLEVDSEGVRTNDDVAQPGFVVSTTHEGLATDALSVTFAADTLVRPTVLATVRTVD